MKKKEDEQVYEFKISEMKIFKYKNCILNLCIFIITIPILLARNKIVSQQNEFIQIMKNYYFEQVPYREVITNTNIICFLALILIIYALISTYFMYKEKNINSNIINFIIRKINEKESIKNKIIEKKKIIVTILTILTLIILLFAIFNEGSFISEFKQEMEIYETSKTNALIIDIKGHHLSSGLENPLLYIFIISYIGMFTMWEFIFREEIKKEK